MSSSEQLEHQAEQCRARISDNLAELRDRMTPGEVVDQLADYARRSGGGQFFRNLQQQVVDNPLPLTLVGAGIAWLMMGRRVNGARQGGGDGAGMMERADEAVGAAHGAGQSLYAGTSTSDALRGATSSAYGSAAQAANRAAEGLRSATTSLGSATASLGSSAAGTTQSMLDALKAQPLALAGIGLALGAALGALFPASEAENRAMGEASDGIKQSAQEMAGEQVDKAKAVAERAYEGAKAGAMEEAARREPGSAAEEYRAEAEGAGGQVQTESPALVPTNDEVARQTVQEEVPAPAVHVDRE